MNTNKSEMERALERVHELFENERERYDKESDEYWESLSKDDKLQAFYSVCKRIHKAEIMDKGSYRYALYDVFGFDMNSYVVGMDCGYMDIHNAIAAMIYKCTNR